MKIHRDNRSWLALMLIIWTGLSQSKIISKHRTSKQRLLLKESPLHYIIPVGSIHHAGHFSRPPTVMPSYVGFAQPAGHAEDDIQYSDRPALQDRDKKVLVATKGKEAAKTDKKEANIIRPPVEFVSNGGPVVSWNYVNKSKETGENDGQRGGSNSVDGGQFSSSYLDELPTYSPSPPKRVPTSTVYPPIMDKIPFVASEEASTTPSAMTTTFMPSYPSDDNLTTIADVDGIPTTTSPPSTSLSATSLPSANGSMANKNKDDPSLTEGQTTPPSSSSFWLQSSSTAKPSSMTEKPVYMTEKPVYVTEAPEEVTREPTVVTKPVYVTETSGVVTMKSNIVTKKPNTVIKKPVHLTEKPSNAQLPSYVTKKPNFVTKKPGFVTSKPTPSTLRPSTTSTRPNSWSWSTGFGWDASNYVSSILNHDKSKFDRKEQSAKQQSAGVDNSLWADFDNSIGYFSPPSWTSLPGIINPRPVAKRPLYLGTPSAVFVLQQLSPMRGVLRPILSGGGPFMLDGNMAVASSASMHGGFGPVRPVYHPFMNYYFLPPRHGRAAKSNSSASDVKLSELKSRTLQI